MYFIILEEERLHPVRAKLAYHLEDDVNEVECSRTSIHVDESWHPGITGCRIHPKETSSLTPSLGIKHVLSQPREYEITILCFPRVK